MGTEKKIIGREVRFYHLYELWHFLHYEEGVVYYRNGDDELSKCRAELTREYEQKVYFGETEVTEDMLSLVVGYIDNNYKETSKYCIGRNEYLVLPDDTLIAMLFVGEIPIYWLTDTEAILVDDPKTIYGGTPHRFGIKIGLIDRVKNR